MRKTMLLAFAHAQAPVVFDTPAKDLVVTPASRECAIISAKKR